MCCVTYAAGELTKVLLEAEMVSTDVKMLREVGIDVADIQAALQLKISQTGNSQSHY